MYYCSNKTNTHAERHIFFGLFWDNSKVTTEIKQTLSRVLTWGSNGQGHIVILWTYYEKLRKLKGKIRQGQSEARWRNYLHWWQNALLEVLKFRLGTNHHGEYLFTWSLRVTTNLMAHNQSISQFGVWQKCFKNKSRYMISIVYRYNKDIC